MVAENGQPFLQAKLEPVAASDSVACPIVEILMRDDRLDIGEVGVGRGLVVGQHILVVEEVQPLVLHRAHVEVGHGDDVEDVEVVFAAELLLVPLHRALQRVHRVGGARFLAVLDIDAEFDRAAGRRDEDIADAAEVAGNQGEEIGRFREGIFPDGDSGGRRQDRPSRPDCRWQAAAALRCAPLRCAPCRPTGCPGGRGNR